MNYFLLDANVLVAYYCQDEPASVRNQARSLFFAQSQGKAFLYVPNFCVAEVLRAFAKKCWSEQLYGKGAEADQSFEAFKKAFLDDVIGSKLLYSYELSRRHLILAHQVYEGAAKLSFRKGSPPSAFDTLLIAMGLDLQRIHSRERFYVVTTDGPVFDVCQASTEMPQAINICRTAIPLNLLT